MRSKIISVLLAILALFSGCLENTTTINSDNYSKSVIQHVLDMSDKNITKYINSITVYDNQQLLNDKCRSIKTTQLEIYVPFSQKKAYVGCVEIKYVSDSENSDIDSSDMFILSDNELQNYCDSEGNTVSYLIGLMEYRKKYGSIADKYKESLYAEEYANKVIKDKCSSVEATNIVSKLQLIKDKYNNSLKLYNNEYNLSEDEYYLKWESYISIENLPDKYSTEHLSCFDGRCSYISVACKYGGDHCGVPQEKYSEYTSDYNKYINNTQKYSDSINSSYQEYLENYDQLSEALNESIRNYRYPFEVTNTG